MKKYGQTDENRRQRADGFHGPMQSEPSMSAPSPMPGKPAASYVKQPEKPVSQAEWQPPQNTNFQRGWSASQPPVQAYPVQQGYQPPPSQGIPGGQIPPQQYGWQQAYTPAPPQQGWSQPYQPAGRGWTQPYPVQEQQQASWQGSYGANQWNGGYTPVYPPAPVQGDVGTDASSADAKKPLDKATLIKLAAAAAAVLVLIAVLTGRSISEKNEAREIQQAVAAYDNLYCEGVYVDGIHLGGMTREEAREVVQKSAQLKCDEWNVALVTSAGEYVGEINSYHLGMTVHVDDALDEAWKQGHTGTTYEERKIAMDALIHAPFATSTALPSGDTAAIDRILNELAASVYEPATDATAVFEPILTNPFTITPEKVGKYLNVESIKERVYDMVSRMESGTITIEPTPLYPNVTAADIQRQTTLIGSHYTPISTTSTENRDANIKQACVLINGTVIEPGKNFSFNDVVGPRTKKTGFYLAVEYAYGKQTEGYGGGICQVSSTLYVAAVRANMQILKRTQHSLEVNYTTFGLDATVNYDGRKIDFVFKNNTGGNIYIVTKVMRKPRVDKNHDLVICDIYGPAMEPGVTYDLVATTVEVPIPEATIVPDKKAEHVLYTDETHSTVGKIGYEVDSYRVKYINGNEVERTHMFHDSYAPVQPVTYVGVLERPIETEE